MPIRKTQAGFSLIEILVALVVLAVGLLGIAGMQLIGIRSNSSAGARSQATAIASDIADRMRANPLGVNPAYNNVTSTAVACAAPASICSDYYNAANVAGVTCTPAAMAAYDINVMACGDLYNTARAPGVAARLNNGRFTVTCDTCVASPPMNPTYLITVTWDELDPTQANGFQARSVNMTVFP